MKYQYLEQNPSLTLFKWEDSDEEHNLMRPYCPDASYQIWSIIDQVVCEKITDVHSQTVGPTLSSSQKT